MNENKYWEIRSRGYQGLAWVKNRRFLSEVISACRCKKNDIVLEIGVGTGVVSKSLISRVNKIIGIDVSIDMMKQDELWKDKKCSSIFVLQWDARNLPFRQEVFDLVVSRHTLHHVLTGTQRVLDESYRVLKKGGRIVIGEGNPPSTRTRREYTAIFKVKEKRIVLYAKDIENFMKKAGFRNISSKKIVLKSMSVRNWLLNSGLDTKTQDKIMDMHRNASEAFKADYNLKQTKDDCLIDMHMCIVTGKKI